MKINNEYDAFANIYNRHWGAAYRAKAIPVIRRLLLPQIQPKASILDICCGTGQITSRISALGFAVSGIDASDAMLTYARKNVPAADLTHADVRRFSLNQHFDAAYSVFESLNHVPSLPDLTKAFRNIRRHLKPGAPLLFDLNNEDAFGLYWNTTDALVEKDASCILRMDYNEETRIGTCRFTTFEPLNSLWQRNDFTIHQTCHRSEDVLKALKKTGFTNTVLYRAADIGMKGYTGYGREFYMTIAA